MQDRSSSLWVIIGIVTLVLIIVLWRRQVAHLLRDHARRAADDAAERSRLAAALTAATDVAVTQQATAQQFASELSERLVAQQSEVFERTALALQQRADAEARGMRQLFEQTSVERVQAQVAPLAETLARVASTLEQARELQASAGGRSEALLQSLRDDQARHWEDTRRVHSALRSSQIRGRVGEFTLQRTLEDAGLREHVHYLAQGSDRDEAGAFRPDVVVMLPENRCIVVDAKAPLEHLLAAQATDDPTQRQECVTQHVRALRRHIDQLARKDYATRLQASEQLTGTASVWRGALLFVPTETVLDVALRRDGTLLRYASERHVYLVSPTTLLAVLNTVEQLWRQERLDRQADEIVRLGGELHERLAVVLGHVATLGGALSKTITAYNHVVGSAETRLMPAARGLRETGLRLRNETPTTLRPLEDNVRAVASRRAPNAGSADPRVAESAPIPPAKSA